jgi:hypothetical protein
MHIIGAGLGRTGTYSLKLALNRLGAGPCHHMEAVILNMPVQVPLWAAALAGAADWEAIYAGFNSAVDWPSAAFFGELAGAYPGAKFILTERDPEHWADSFSATIYKAMAGRAAFPAELKPWLDMAHGVIVKSGFPDGLDREGLIRGFVAHNDAVRKAIPADRLLIYQVREGWGPLCGFLGVATPDEPFPRTNDRIEFWERFSGS